MSKNTYTERHEWNEYAVHEAETGYVVEFWSRIRGAMDGRKILVFYSERTPRGMDLKAAWNAHTTNGQAVADIAGRDEGVRVLAAGNKVQ